jgi:hypothetical protein
MKKCKYEGQIDGYLLDKLKPEEQTDFEEHYFICRSCFAKMSERDEIIRVLKKEGVLPAPEGERLRETAPENWLGRGFALLTPRRWALVGVAAAAVLLVVWLVIPRTGTVPPPLVLTDDETLRGAAVTALSPVADIDAAPAYLEWKSAGEDLEYKVSLSGKTPLMSASTKETRIVLPEEIKSRLKPGLTYVWQVQAFKADGALVGMSARIRFRIRPKS